MRDEQGRPVKSYDLITVKSTEAWSISLSRKERCVYIKTDDYHAGPLRLTRDELYNLGRMMSRKNMKRGQSSSSSGKKA